MDSFAAVIVILLAEFYPTDTLMLQRDLHQALHARTLALRDRVAALARPLDPEQLVRRPPDGGWSVGQVLEHLCVSAELYDGPVRGLLETGRPDAAAPLRPWKPTLIGRFSVNMFERPNKMPAPKKMVPGATPRAGVVEKFIAHQDGLARLMDDAAGYDWRRLRMGSPIFPLPIKFNLGDVFFILVVHAERHARQMDRVIAAIR